MDKDENLLKIKAAIKNIFPDSKIILFGSRARKDFDNRSDYDILVVVKQNLEIKEKRQYESVIRKKLDFIPLDIIVKTEEDMEYFLDKIGSVVREAMKYGVNL